MEKNPTENIFEYNLENDENDPQSNLLNEVQDSGDYSEKAEDKKSPFLLMLNVLFNPVEGWKKMRREKLKPEKFQSDCFYPLLALLAVSKFSALFYSPKISVSSMIVDGVVAFVSFFFGYFCILVLVKALLNKKASSVFETDFGKNFVILSLSTLSLFSIFTDLLPMLWPILIFLPLWTIYIICKGIRFFRLSENGSVRQTVIICSSIVGIPYLISWLLGMILPV